MAKLVETMTKENYVDTVVGSIRAWLNANVEEDTPLPYVTFRLDAYSLTITEENSIYKHIKN